MENRQYFDTDNLITTYFRQSLPVVFSMMITVIYNLADTWFIARTNNAMLVAGVSLCSPLFMLLMAIGNIFGQGGSSLIARMLGRGEREGVARVSAGCFYAAILVGVVVAFPLVLFREPVLKLFGASAETLPHAMEYYTVLAVSAPACILSFIHSNLLRSEGLSVQSVIGMIAGSLLNIVLDPILISGLGWGARGAAVATVLGYLLTDVLYIFIVRRKSQCLSMNPAKARLSGEEVRQILGVGTAAAITNIASAVCVVFMNKFLAPYGDDRIAALGIASRIITIVQLVLVGFSFGGIPLFGFLYGAGDTEKLKRILRFCTLFLCGTALLFSVVLCLLATPAIRLFIDHAGIIAEGTRILRWQVSGMVFCAIVLLFTCLFQALGKAPQALIMSVSRQGVLFILVFIIATTVAGYNGFLAAQLISDLLSAVLALLVYRTIARG
ncbi:MAG: MATE family efflux transporter [Clostridia bacterium]|nr:MATE family efflux transporter [Clostridia bacterium]